MSIYQDWEPVVWKKSNNRNRNETKKQYIDRLKKSGKASTILRNKNPNNFNKIEKNAEEGILKHKKISRKISKNISKQRLVSKISQQELARKINVHVNIIKQYENISSEVIPNPKILNKIESIIGRVRE